MTCTLFSWVDATKVATDPRLGSTFISRIGKLEASFKTFLFNGLGNKVSESF